MNQNNEKKTSKNEKSQVNFIGDFEKSQSHDFDLTWLYDLRNKSDLILVLKIFKFLFAIANFNFYIKSRKINAFKDIHAVDPHRNGDLFASINCKCVALHFSSIFHLWDVMITNLRLTIGLIV